MKYLSLLLLGCSTFGSIGCDVKIEGTTANTPLPASDTQEKPSYEPVDPKITQELSALLQKREETKEVSEEEKQRIEELLRVLLPGKEYIGEDNEWQMNVHNNLISLDLRETESNTRHMWFHVLYEKEPPEYYGSDDFVGYRGMGAKDAHYFIMVNQLELRAVGDSPEYRNDKQIKDMLKAFNLEAIEKL